MQDQHKKISGYRDLTQAEIDLMNKLKEMEGAIGDLLRGVEAQTEIAADREAGRWVALARTNLETGMMYAIKAVARPTNGLGRTDPS